MNESNEKDYGRWGNIATWLKEANTITEKHRPGKVRMAKKRPVSRERHIIIYIPRRRHESGYGGAMEGAMALLIELGRRPMDAYIEDDHFAVRLKPAPVNELKALDEQVRRWLANNGFAILTPQTESAVPDDIIFSQ